MNDCSETIGWLKTITGKRINISLLIKIVRNYSENPIEEKNF